MFTVHCNVVVILLITNISNGAIIFNSYTGPKYMRLIVDYAPFNYLSFTLVTKTDI